jgi:hypothetical protein
VHKIASVPVSTSATGEKSVPMQEVKINTIEITEK